MSLCICCFFSQPYSKWNKIKSTEGWCKRKSTSPGFPLTTNWIFTYLKTCMEIDISLSAENTPMFYWLLNEQKQLNQVATFVVFVCLIVIYQFKNCEEISSFLIVFSFFLVTSESPVLSTLLLCYYFSPIWTHMNTEILYFSICMVIFLFAYH